MPPVVHTVGMLVAQARLKPGHFEAPGPEELAALEQGLGVLASEQLRCVLWTACCSKWVWLCLSACVPVCAPA